MAGWNPAFAEDPSRQETIEQGQRYQKEGRYAEAEKSYRLALVKAEKLGAKDPRLAKSLIDLAVLLQKKGNYAEAERLCRRALEIYQVALGPSHSNVAATLNHLAALSWDQGRFAECEELCKQALSIEEKILGPTIPTLPVAWTTWVSPTASRASTVRQRPSSSGRWVSKRESLGRNTLESLTLETTWQSCTALYGITVRRGGSTCRPASSGKKL